jgi:hypothetical protein
MMDEYTPCQCDVCKIRAFERNHFFPRKLLTPRDLADEQKYFNEKRWLINRMVVGWGIVCGLDVSVEPDQLTVQPGLALDCCGRELLVCDRRCVKFEGIPEAAGYRPPEPPRPGYERPQYGGDGGYERVRWALCLEYRECRTEPTKVPNACEPHDRGREYNRIRDDYTLTVRPWKKACPDDHSADCCEHEGLSRAMSLHKALVERAHKCPCCEDCTCVVLATGDVDAQGRVYVDEDAWKYRRIVYTNPALAGVIRCLHDGLAHISRINWTPGWHFKVDEFLDRLCNERLQVTFDRPMRARTVTNVRSCRLTIYCVNGESACPQPFVIPVQRIDYDEDQSIATYYFDDDCIEQDLRKVCKRLRKPADVELILHGSMIHNAHGRALDAELIDALPTGNGIEGGEFIAFFTVGP